MALELPDPDTHIPYTITAQEQREELTPDGRFVEVWNVSFTSPSGTHSSVKVPAPEYTPANVDALIQAQLHAVESVHALGEEPHPENLAQ